MAQNQLLNAESVELLRTHFPARNEPNVAWGNAISGMLWLSRLISLWPMSSLSRDAATVRDIAGEGYHLTNNNNVAFQFSGLYPYGAYTSGSSMYLSRAHSTAIALTNSCWFSTFIYPTVAGGTTQGIISKFVAGTNNRAFRIVKDASEQITFQISNAGTAIDATVSSGAVSLNTNYHIFGLFLASSSLSVWVNGTRTDNTTSIPASIFNATGADLEIGRSNAGSYWDGRIGATMMGRAVGTLANWDVIAKNIYQQFRPIWGG